MTQTPPTNRSFIPYGDAIRVVGAFLVVMVHTMNNFFASSCCNGNWYFLMITKALGMTAVALFFILSGAIFLQTTDTPSVKSFYHKRWQRIWGPLLGWGTVYALWNWYYGWFNGVWPYVRQGMYYHFYFLFVVMWLYLLTPLLRRLFLPKNHVSLYLVLTGSFLAGTWHWLFMYQTAPHPLANIHFYVGAIFYYLLGGLMLQHNWKFPTKLLGLGFVASLALTTWFGTRWGMQRGIDGSGTFPAISVFQPFQAITAFCLYWLIAASSEHLNIWKRWPKVVSLLSEASMHCYLGHVLFLQLTAPYTLSWKTGPFGPLVIVLEAVGMFAAFNAGYWIITRGFTQLTAGIFSKLRYNKNLAKAVTRENSSAG